MISLILELHNFITSPISNFILSRQSCPISLVFSENFTEYFYYWVTFVLLIWGTVHAFFSTILERLLRRMGLTLSRARRTSSALWSAGSSLGAVLLSSSQLNTSPWSLEHQSELDDVTPPPHIIMYLTVLETCLMQNLVLNYIRHGRTLQTLADILQIVIIPAAYTARWTEIAFSISFLISSMQFLAELARIFLSIKKGLYFITLFVYIAYSMLWVTVYLGSLPAWLVTVANTTSSSQEIVFGLAMLFLFLAGHILVSCTASPLTLMIKGCLRGAPLAEWLELSLFPGTDRAMHQMRKQARAKRISMDALAHARERERAEKSKPVTPAKQSLLDEAKTVMRADAKALLQTVRCVTLLKRKIRTMREKKILQAEKDSERKENESKD